MTQAQAVKEALRRLGGIATLKDIYRETPKIPGCVWRTKTPEASIRRIVQQENDIICMRPGYYELSEYRERRFQQHLLEKFDSGAATIIVQGATVNQHIAHVDQVIVPSLKSQADSVSSPQEFCTYIVPSPPKPREEIEADLVRTSQQSASVFSKCLMRLEKQCCLDFGHDDVKTIFRYLKQRYSLSYTYANFSAVFPASRRKT